MVQKYAFKWFVRDSALAGTAVLHCLIHWTTVLPLLPTKQPKVQIMARCRSGDKPLSEPMLLSFRVHICATRLQWVNFMQVHSRVWRIYCARFMLYAEFVDRHIRFFTKPRRFSLNSRYIIHIFNSLALGWFKQNFEWVHFKLISKIDGWVSLVKLPSDECHWTILMVNQHWFRWWLGAIGRPTTHSLTQWWPRSVLSYGIDRP